MTFLESLKHFTQVLKNANVQHALIGGLALGAYGYARATNDVDIIVAEKDAQIAKSSLQSIGFAIFFESKNVLQLHGDIDLDIIFVKHPLGLRMLAEAKEDPVLKIPIVKCEDLIGLKVQSYTGNPKRRFKDLADIQALIEANPNLDKVRVKELTETFGEWKTIETLFLNRDQE